MKSQHQRFRNIVQGVACNLIAFALTWRRDRRRRNYPYCTSNMVAFVVPRARCFNRGMASPECSQISILSIEPGATLQCFLVPTIGGRRSEIQTISIAGPSRAFTSKTR